MRGLRVGIGGLLLALVTLFVAGCADVVEMESMQSRAVAGSDPDVVLAEAAVILRREFGPTQLNASAGTIKTLPAEYVTEKDSGSARDFYGGRSQMRRYATMSVAKRGDAVVASVRVDLERKDTGKVSSASHASNPTGDSPGAETPIMRDAGTTEQQNTVWTRVRRDFTLERSILDELRERMARLSPDADASGAASPSASQPSGKP